MTSLAPEGIVILDILTRLVPHPRVITVDTQRLPVETYDLIERVRHRFDVEIDVIQPEPAEVHQMVRIVRRTCSTARERTGSAAGGPQGPPVAACTCGRRRLDHRAPPGTVGDARSDAEVARDLVNGSIWKIAPLADWSSGQVWDYIRARDLPYNALHDDDYESIGCAPCTKPVAPGGDERSGRWWWEAQDAERECGIHSAPGASTEDGPA